LRALGLEEERVRLQWASAAEGQLLADSINEMVDQIRELGPLNWPKQWTVNGAYQAAVDKLAEEHAEVMEVPA
jgi:F420-non-reducing hydrogenase iron-sulfur subunit